MFKTYNQGQNFLLPPNFKEFIWESHESIILDELINELDISKLIWSYSNENIWASAYHPRMLLKIMIYAYISPSQNFSKILTHFRLYKERNLTSSRIKKTPKNKVFFWWFSLKINLTSLKIWKIKSIYSIIFIYLWKIIQELQIKSNILSIFLIKDLMKLSK